MVYVNPMRVCFPFFSFASAQLLVVPSGLRWLSGEMWKTQAECSTPYGVLPHGFYFSCLVFPIFMVVSEREVSSSFHQLVAQEDGKARVGHRPERGTGDGEGVDPCTALSD